MYGLFELLLSLTGWSVLVMAIIGVCCLVLCRGEENHKHLVRTTEVFLGALALLAGGNILLRQFGLTWRSGPEVVLFGVMLVSGWLGVLFTLACFLPLNRPGSNRFLRRGAKAAALFFGSLLLLVSLWMGPMMLIFACGDDERVMEYQDQLLLEVDDGFMDPHWSYYVYHGPLVRGRERVYEDYEPLVYS